jgi:hypothetical protein
MWFSTSSTSCAGSRQSRHVEDALGHQLTTITNAAPDLHAGPGTPAGLLGPDRSAFRSLLGELRLGQPVWPLGAARRSVLGLVFQEGWRHVPIPRGVRHLVDPVVTLRQG